MDDSTPTATPSNDTELCVFQRTVTLYDWWLIKAKNDFQGKRLAVAGISSRKDEAMRVFVSAPVIKRYDVFSLKTADGIYLIISGFINEQRTIENGFAPQVFNRFLFGFPPDWESCALDFSREESATGNDLGSAFLDDVPDSCPEILSDEEAPGDHKYDCNVAKGIGGVNHFCSGGGKRRGARLHDIKVCQQKKQAASGGVENCSPTFLASPERAQRDQEKAFPENECNLSKEVAGVDVACCRGRERRSARLRDVKVYQQKKRSASGLPPKNPNNKNHISVAALDNCDVVGPKSPETPIQSKSWRQLCTSSEQIVKKSVISRTLSPKTEGCHKKKVSRPKGTPNKSASAGKNSRSRDRSHLTKGSRQKNSTVSPESSSFRTSRSGRLLVPPLEFWRNQIPIYDADHVLKEIKDGASLISPCRVSSSSSSRKDRL